MSQPWVCRLYRPGDEAGIIDLYGAVFTHMTVTPEFWRWMYLRCRGGPAVISVVESQGRLVGHYGIQPRTFWIAGREQTVGLAVGVMLLPEARNVATVAQMAKVAAEEAKCRGWPWLYAFPNDPSYKVHCKLLGWNPLPPLVEWDGPLPSSTKVAAADMQVWHEMPADLEFDTIDAQCPKRPISPSRGTNWLKWRFFDRPGGEYVLHTIARGQQVVAYAITKRYQRDAVRYGHILDWRLLPDAADRSSELLASVWRQLAQWQVERVSTWAHGRDDLAALLAAAGLIQTGRQSNFCTLDFSAGLLSALADASAWQLEMADSDIY